MYANGLGVDQDDEQAVLWCSKAAEQGLAKAQFNLGDLYASGRRVERNDNQAIFWYRKAAKQGHIQAQENLTKLGITWNEK
jgi:hypothetical protein